MSWSISSGLLGDLLICCLCIAWHVGPFVLVHCVICQSAARALCVMCWSISSGSLCDFVCLLICCLCTVWCVGLFRLVHCVVC